MTEREKLPTKTEIRKARKKELQEMCENLGLDTGGKVEELRARLRDFVEEEKEEVEVVEGEYQAKIKPLLDDDVQRALRIRQQRKKRKPEFRRQEWFRYKRLGDAWRKPRGLHSKMRRHLKYRPKVVSKGYRGTKKARGLHPSGFQEVMVFNLSDLDAINPKTQAARIGHSVGVRKRLEIEKKADEIGIRVLNRSI